MVRNNNRFKPRKGVQNFKNYFQPQKKFMTKPKQNMAYDAVKHETILGSI